jgi:hypothetical protein
MVRFWPVSGISPARWPHRLHGTTTLVAWNSCESALIWNANPPSVAYPDGEAADHQHGLCEKTVSSINLLSS